MSDVKLKKAVYCAECFTFISGKKYKKKGSHFTFCKKCKKLFDKIRNNVTPIEYKFASGVHHPIQLIKFYFKDMDILIDQLQKIRERCADSTHSLTEQEQLRLIQSLDDFIV